jgi:regulator of protease activity HflC (stomatin/prohibitin superfamily)
MSGQDNYGTHTATNGWYVVGVMVLFSLVGIFGVSWELYGLSILAAAVTIFLGFGLFILNPKIVAVATFFGKSRGNIRGEGLLWANPLYRLIKVSTRSDITRTPVAKINDLSGNPIMAAMQGQWFIERPAHSVFNIDKTIKEYVQDVFSACLRTLISQYDYDGINNDGFDESESDFTLPEDSEDEVENMAVYLRTSSDQINEKLKELAQEQLDIAGVNVVTANLVDLAYAPEIAGAMLQVQQAKAFLNARRKIV